MPGAGGLKSIPRIIAAAGGARIMIVSSLAEEGAEQTVAALALGAADTLPKPGTGRFNGRFSEILLGKLKALGHAGQPADRRAIATPSQASGTPLRAMPTDPIEHFGDRRVDRRNPRARDAVPEPSAPNRRPDPRHPASCPRRS